MATFHISANNIGYLEMSYGELMSYSRIPELVCDDCNALLKHDEVVTVVPILNEGVCPRCAPDKLSRVKDYPEDRPIRERREKFWCDFYGIEATV